MPTDPFSSVILRFNELVPRLVGDAPDVQELMPAMLGEVRTFCAECVDSARIDQSGRLGAEVLAGVAARGWFGLTVPEEHGGAGLSLGAATRVVSELAAHDGSLGTCVGLHCGLGLHALLHAATPALKARYLPEIASGRRIAAFAATEPGAGSDISAVQTRLGQRGSRLQLDGEKCFVTNGGVCGIVTVLARSPGLGGARSGHALVLVDPGWPGITRGAEERKLGLKGSSTVTLRFEGVPIPSDHVLGGLSQGLAHGHAALAWGRTFLAAGCLGSARSALADAGRHVRTRAQFGRSLLHFPLVRETLARARAAVHSVDCTLRLTTALHDGHGADIGLPSTILKVLASEAAFEVVDHALQLMGGAGYIEDNGMARRLRDVRVTRIFEGANDVLRLSLAGAAITWPTAVLAGLTLSACLPPALATEARHFDVALDIVIDAIRYLKRKWGFRLFEQQAVAVELADAIVALFAALAVLGSAAARPDGPRLALSRLALELELQRAIAGARRAMADREPSLSRLLDEACDGAE